MQSEMEQFSLFKGNNDNHRHDRSLQSSNTTFIHIRNISQLVYNQHLQSAYFSSRHWPLELILPIIQ